MSKPRLVLIALLTIGTGFILSEWRKSVVAALPTLKGSYLTSLSSKATIQGTFRLETLSVWGADDPGVEFLVGGKMDGYGWGGHLPDLSSHERELLGKSNVATITNLGKEMHAHDLHWMAKDPTVTVFEDWNGNFYLRWENGGPKPSQYSNRVLKDHTQWGQSDGWLIYR